MGRRLPEPDYIRLSRRFGSRLFDLAQEAGRYVPLTSVGGDDRYGSLVIACQHTLDRIASLRLKGDTVTNLELKHLDVGSRLIEEAKPLDNPMVEVDEFGLGQLIDVDPHQFLLWRLATAARAAEPASPLSGSVLRD